MNSPIRVASLYRFARFRDPAALAAPLEECCRANSVKGTLLLAHEGINGTIAGVPSGIDRVVSHIRTLPGCEALAVRYSDAGVTPFRRLKVRLKPEIVTMGIPAIDPPRDAGHHVDPADWNALIDDPDTIVIDTRNDYEVAVGTFANAINPGTPHFRDFPDWLRANRAKFGERRRVAMFCTGGIRCEKATAYAAAEGLDDVYHLKGGILAYLDSVPREESLWRGECFVFDERVAVGHGLESGTHTLCRACRRPLGPDDRASPDYRPGIACPHCHTERDEAKKRGYAERHRQELLAAARGTTHVGATIADRRLSPTE